MHIARTFRHDRLWLEADSTKHIVAQRFLAAVSRRRRGIGSGRHMVTTRTFPKKMTGLGPFFSGGNLHAVRS
jgi:hypothetical protein